MGQSAKGRRLCCSITLAQPARRREQGRKNLPSGDPNFGLRTIAALHRRFAGSKSGGMCNLIGINVQGNAVFKLPGLTIVASLHAIALAAAQPVCLPASVFVKNANKEFPVIDLGYIDNVLTLCAYQRALDPNVHKLLGCWTVNSTTAALGASAATAIPGRGRHTDLDGQNCINGYCIAPISADDNRPFFAASTDGAHAAIMTEHLLYIFATSTKAKVAEIELIKQGAPDGTNISNMPWGLLYSGDVFGQDAGPFTGAWVFKEDGSRAGIVGDDADTLNIFKGGYGILGGDKVALADAGLQNMTIVTGANAAKQATKRITSYAPCTKDQFDQWTRSTVRRYHHDVKRTCTGLHSGAKSSRTNRKTSAKTRSVPIVQEGRRADAEQRQNLNGAAAQD